MEMLVEGDVIRVMKPREGKKNYGVSILVKRSDGQKDVLTVWTPKDSYKAGTVFKGKIDAFLASCREVV